MTTFKREISKREINQIFSRSLSMEASFNYERMMSLGFGYAMEPVIKKLYNEPEKQKEAMKRHMEFFNCTSATAPFILGVAASMEERKSKDPNFDVNSINAMKAGLMGPLSGIGDSIFWGSLRIIASGVGIALAQQGNILGPILFLLIFNIPNLLVRYFGALYGYKAGVSFIDKMNEGGTMQNITYAINILGNVVIGAMVASMVLINIPIQVSGGEEPQTIQMVLDAILPAMLPLAATFYIKHLTKKNVKMLYILLGIIIISIFGAVFKFLA